ncbi:hypothetical protein N9B31_07545 [Mariniblastus sp.]|nr:hypothetical protein [Mariniblastus sp.]MDB4372243.1 hypothetical protein [Mariniblastus sp.]
MYRFLLTAIIFVLAAGASTGVASAQLPVSTSNAVEQLLVLSNGEILRGQISRSAEQVIVVTHQGSRLVIPAERTVFVCDSLQEAYWGKAARIRASDLIGQQKLFHWCLKNRLFDLAQNQIDLLLQSNLKAVELEYLDRQLNVALSQRRSSQKQETKRLQQNPSRMASQGEPSLISQGSPGVIPGINTHAPPLTERYVFRPLPILDESIGTPVWSEDAVAKLSEINLSELVGKAAPVADVVKQVGFEEDVEIESVFLNRRSMALSNGIEPPAPTETDDRVMIPVAELDKETRSMPDGTLGLYRRRIEGLFVAGCSAAKCHDSNSRVMPLMHLGRTVPIPRRQSQRNLHNVLKYVDREHAFDSDLFRAATLVHAGNSEPFIAKDSVQYENLSQWLIMLNRDPSKARLEFIQLKDEPLEPVVSDNQAPRVEPVQPEPLSLLPVPQPIPGSEEAISEIPEVDRLSPKFTPQDPFDPEIFNRNHGK